MTESRDDDALMAELGGVLSADAAVPDSWRAAAHGAFAWRGIDQELLELTHDSAEEGALAVRGSTTTPRVLAFGGGGGLTLEVELDDRRISGELSGYDDTLGPVEITFESADGRSRVVQVDEDGFFTLDNEDHGLVRFAVRAGDARFVTQWIVL